MKSSPFLAEEEITQFFTKHLLIRLPNFQGPLPEEGRVGDVVVHKLSPLHDVVGVKLGGGVEVRNDGDGDETGRGELGTTHRVGLGPPNTVTVHRVQHTLQTK